MSSIRAPCDVMIRDIQVAFIMLHLWHCAAFDALE
jgi:hypothetical protein